MHLIKLEYLRKILMLQNGEKIKLVSLFKLNGERIMVQC